MLFGFIALEAGTPTDQRLRVDDIVDSPATNGAAQGEELSSTTNKSQPGRRPPAAKGEAKPGGADRGDAREQEMGAALRSVYQRAVDERVPDDLMDLLGKLG